MAPIALAILPVFLLIFLGYGLRARRLLAEAFWEPAERLTYFVLFPALLVVTLAGADLGALAAARMGAALVAANLAMTGTLFLLRPALGLPGPAFTSLFQGSIRHNTYIGLAVAFGLFAGQGLAAAAVAVAVNVPLVNLLSVLVLARYGQGARPTWRRVARQLAGNPLILACALGLGLNLSGLGLPPVVEPLLAILGRGALPLGLLAVGAALDFTAARAGGRAIGAAVGLKLLALPVITALACRGLEVGPVAAFVAVLFNGTPAAPTSYILARQLGGDARVMAGIIAVQTAVALISLPLALALLAEPPG